MRSFRALTRASQEKAGDLATTVEQSVQGIRVLKALGRGEHALAGFERGSRQLKNLEIKRGSTMGMHGADGYHQRPDAGDRTPGRS